MASTAWSPVAGVATPWGTQAITVAAGTPMGLLLTLTYATAFVTNIILPTSNPTSWTPVSS